MKSEKRKAKSEKRKSEKVKSGFTELVLTVLTFLAELVLTVLIIRAKVGFTVLPTPFILLCICRSVISLPPLYSLDQEGRKER